MRCLVQWAKSKPTDWDEIDSSQWKSLPAKPDPTGTNARVDEQPGWINALNIQGLVFSGYDHYHIEHVDAETCIVSVWRDDPTDYAPDERHAVVWTIKTLAPDPKFNGAINTRQSNIVYAAPLARIEREARGWVCRPWEDFEAPARAVMHGKALPDADYAAHKKARRHVGWREFTDGLPESELVDGKVPSQRRLGRYVKPKGTRTYYASNTYLGTGIHSASNEFAFLTTTGEATEVIESIGKAKEELAFCFTSPENEPNSDNWPSGNYRYWIDCTTAEADISYGMLTINSTVGHFARVDGGLSDDLETWTQTDPAYTGTGLKEAQTGTIDPLAGNATDRWEALICAGNANTKDAQNFGITLNEADDYTDGPWPAAVLEANAQAATADADAISATVTPGAVQASAALATADTDSISPTVTPGAVQVSAVPAQANADSLDATVTPGAVQASAEFATAQADAVSPTVTPGAVSTSAVPATADADALEATVTPGEVQASAQLAQADADALAATAKIALSAPAETSTADADALPATVTPGEVQVAAAFADAQADALPADATVPEFADAQFATAAADAISATVTPGGVSASAGFAQAVADAQAATVLPGEVQVPAVVADAQATAVDTTVTPGEVQVPAGLAQADADAISPTVTPGGVSVSAGLAQADADALPATVTPGEVQVSAQLTQAQADALDAGAQISIGLQADAQTAQAHADAQAMSVSPGPVQTSATLATSEIDALDAAVQPGEVQVAAQLAQAFANAIDVIAGTPDARKTLAIPGDPTATFEEDPEPDEKHISLPDEPAATF